MSKVAILTDSTAYLPQTLLDQYQIHVVPLGIIWGEETYQDGVDLKAEDFYRRLSTSRVMPTTSQIPVAVMQQAFQSLLDQDFHVLGIFISSKFSGTYQSAVQAREELAHAAERVAVVDSLTTTMAMGWPVLTAARAAQAGESLDRCRKAAENARDHSGVLFVVETLEFLRRGGRIGGAQALLGNLLNVKPVLQMQDGRIEPVEKVRTKRKAMQRVVDVVAERVSAQSPVRLAVAHADSAADAAWLMDTAKAQMSPIETLVCPLSPVIGTHAGPGTVSLNYMCGVE
ncbi:MAG: DegV family protein [Chloroflexi bacterium]|nr:DegV family protein [Chloroflexota bacterium]